MLGIVDKNVDRQNITYKISRSEDKNVDTDNLDCFHPLIFAGRQPLLSLIHNISSNPAG